VLQQFLLTIFNR